MPLFNIKCNNGTTITVEAELTCKVLDFKELISPKVDVPAALQRLIYSGKVLKDPETLERSNKKKVECEKRTDGNANKLTDAMSTDEKNANKDPANAADANAKFSGIKLDADARVSMGGKGVKGKGEGQTIAKDGFKDSLILNVFLKE